MQEELKELDVLKEVKKNKQTNVDKKFTFGDLNKIWRKLTEFISNRLKENKSVSIKGLGVFTLRKWEVYAGIEHEIKHFEPVFLLSKLLLEHFDLHQRKQYSTDMIPTAPIKTCEIATECNLSKENVILCLDEIVQCLRRLIAEGANIQLKFPNLGELKITNSIATFHFFKEMKPNKKLEIEPCGRYEPSMKPYHKPKMCPCPIHSL